MKLLKQVLALAVFAIAVAAQAQNVFYNGVKMTWDDNQPFTSGGTLFMPARDTVARIGADLERNENGKRLQISWSGNSVTFRQGDRFFMLNDSRVGLPDTSQARNGVLYIPFELFGRLTNGVVSRRGGGDDTGGNRVFFNDRRITFSGDQQMYTKGGVLMVPFRAMGDAIGARTDRSPDGKRVWIYFDNDRVEYDKGHDWYRFNTDRRDLRTISEDRNGVLFVPVTLFVAATRNQLDVR